LARLKLLLLGRKANVFENNLSNVLLLSWNLLAGSANKVISRMLLACEKLQHITERYLMPTILLTKSFRLVKKINILFLHTMPEDVRLETGLLPIWLF